MASSRLSQEAFTISAMSHTVSATINHYSTRQDVAVAIGQQRNVSASSEENDDGKQQRVRDFKHAVDRGDMNDKSDLDVYNDLKQRLLAYERRRKDHEEHHSAEDAPTVAAPVVEGKKANASGESK